MQHYKTEIASLRQKSNTSYQGLLIIVNFLLNVHYLKTVLQF